MQINNITLAVPLHIMPPPPPDRPGFPLEAPSTFNLSMPGGGLTQ